MFVKNGLYDLGGFGTDGIKKTSCSCRIIQIIVVVSLAMGTACAARIWFTRCRRRLWIWKTAPLLCQGESRISCWNRVSLLVYNVPTNLVVNLT
jgi:hypothetical protein